MDQPLSLGLIMFTIAEALRNRLYRSGQEKLCQCSALINIF